jgi:hypothetical protein
LILRRVIAHFRKQEWTAIAIDFLIVVVGVFIGIQVSNWNAARVERSAEAQYLARLSGDLRLISESAETHLQFEQNKSKEIATALAMTREPLSDAKRLRLGHVLTAISIRISPAYESPTFNDLQGSGRLGLITDDALRARLAAYMVRLQYLGRGLGKNNDFYTEPFVAYLRSEGIGSGWAEPGEADDVELAPMEVLISEAVRARFGARDIHAHSSALALPPDDPFWERIRAELTWRGSGSANNERLLKLMIAETSEVASAVDGESVGR